LNFSDFVTLSCANMMNKPLCILVHDHVVLESLLGEDFILENLNLNK